MSVTQASGPSNSVDLGTRIAFGSGAAAYGVVDNGFNYFLLFFYSQVLGAPAALAGTAILVALLVDAVADPLIGTVSDRLNSRWGRRHPFMYASAIPIALGFWLIWNPPPLDGAGLVLYLGIAATVLRVSLALYEIPSMALVSDMSRGYDERTALLSYRFLFQWGGGLIVGLAMYWLLLRPTPDDATGYFNVAGYHSYGLLGCVIILIAVLVSSLGTQHLVPRLARAPLRQASGLRRSISELVETLSSRAFLAIFASTVILGLGAALAAALAVYFNTYLWQLSPSQVALIFLSGLVSAPLAFVLARVAGRVLEKKQAAIAIAALAFVIAPMPMILRLLGIFPQNSDPVFFPLFLGITAFDLALVIAAQILIASMVADIPDQSELKTGRRSEGVFFAAQMFARKAVSGLGVMLAGVVLEVARFPRSGEAPDPADALALASLYVPIMLAVYMLGLIALGFYDITRASQQTAAEKLAMRSE